MLNDRFASKKSTGISWHLACSILFHQNSSEEAIVRDQPLRQTGIGVVGDVPWGTHFFLFHETKEDLIDACVPYFQAGLENRELCMWVIADPLTEEEVRYCVKHAISGFDDYFENGSLEIVRGREWYMNGNDLDLEKVTRDGSRRGIVRSMADTPASDSARIRRGWSGVTGKSSPNMKRR